MLQFLPDAQILFVMRAYNKPLEERGRGESDMAKTIIHYNGFLFISSLTHICDYIESATSYVGT